MATNNRDDLFLFLRDNAFQLKLNNTAAIQNRYNKLKQINLNYNDLLTCNGSDLRNKLKEAGLKPSQQLTIIQILKKQRNTYIYRLENKIFHDNIKDIIDVTNDADRTLVDGYIRINYLKNKNVHISKDIINLIFLFYHILIRDMFKYYNPKNYKLSNDGKTLTAQGIDDGVCYGALEIPSVNGGIYTWTFKVLKRIYGMAIGIDATKYIRKAGEFQAYALWSDGIRNKKDEWIKWKVGVNDNLTGFETNDIVTMILNLSCRTLLYKINDGEKEVLFKGIEIGQDINYSMSVYVNWSKGQSIELLQ